MTAFDPKRSFAPADLQWLKAFMRGAGPAVIGALAASLGQMAPHAAPDAFTALLMIATLAIILLRNVGPLPLIASGAIAGAFVRRVPLEWIKDLVE
jgi:chromate transport protein ChrA